MNRMIQGHGTLFVVFTRNWILFVQTGTQVSLIAERFVGYTEDKPEAPLVAVIDQFHSTLFRPMGIDGANAWKTACMRRL